MNTGIINIEEVKLLGIDGYNKKAFVEVSPKVGTTHLPISELTFCLQTYGSENGILKGQFQYMEYRGNKTLLCVGSEKHKKALQKVTK